MKGDHQDTLDDAIKDAKDAGFSTSVQTRTEKVSSQSEADRLNQEEASRVQALAQLFRPKFNKLKPVTNLSVKLLHRGSEKARGSTPG